MDHEGLRVSLVAGGNNLRSEDLPQYLYSEKTGRLNWRNISSLRVSNPALYEDPAFEDLIKNFISSRLVESDLDKIGDERMLRVLLLDQLLLENLLALQDQLVADIAVNENKLSVSIGQQQARAAKLEQNNGSIEENRAQISLKNHQLQQLKSYKQQISAFKCNYCGKMFKNLHFLERHYVTKESHNLLLEKEAELANEELMRQHKVEQEAKNRLQQEELQKREQEHRQLMDEVNRLKSVMEKESNEKLTMKKQLDNVNHELTSTADKISQMEAELTLKVKEIERIKIEAEEKSQTQSQALARTMELLQKTKAEVHQLAAQQTAPAPPITSTAKAGTTIEEQSEKPAGSIKIEPGSGTPAGKEINQAARKEGGDPAPSVPQTTIPQTAGPSDTLIELTGRLMTRDPRYVLAPDKTWSQDRPNPEIVAAVAKLLEDKGFSKDDPVGVGPGKASSSILFPILVDGLVEKKILVVKETPVEAKTVIAESNNPSQTKIANPAGKFKGSLGDEDDLPANAAGTAPQKAANSNVVLAKPGEVQITPSPENLVNSSPLAQRHAIQQDGLPTEPQAAVAQVDQSLPPPPVVTQLEQSQNLVSPGDKTTYHNVPDLKFDSLLPTKLSLADLQNVLNLRGDVRLYGNDIPDSKNFSSSRLESTLKETTQLTPQSLEVMTSEDLSRALEASRQRLQQTLTKQTRLFAQNRVDYKNFQIPGDLILSSEPRVELIEDPSSKIRSTISIAGLFNQQIKRNDEDQKFLQFGAFNIGELMTEKKYQEERAEIDKKRTAGAVSQPAKPPQAPNNQ